MIGTERDNNYQREKNSMSDLYRIGIDLGGTTVTAGLVDEENKILH